MPEGDFRDCYSYQLQAARTIGGISSMRDGLALASLGIAGEAGEVVEIVKKHLFHSKPLDLVKLEKELGDVMWYIAAMCHVTGLDLGMVAYKNLEKLEKRFPNGFNPAHAAAKMDEVHHG